jgi:hypothetical protein
MLYFRRLRRTLGPLVLSCLLVFLLAPASAWAIPYFNVEYGFDNSSLGRGTDYAIADDAAVPFVQDGGINSNIGLLAFEEINDTDTMIDRTITWRIFNNAPEEVPELVLFLSALVSGRADYSSANFDVEIYGEDPMSIASFGPYFFAGFHLLLEDFELVKGRLLTTRTFRYTADVPLDPREGPKLGIAYTTNFAVPEPATGLLFSAALVLAVGVGRRRRA